MGEPGGTVSGRSMRQKDGKARRLTRQEARSLAGQAACSVTEPHQRPAACPPDSCWMKQGDRSFGDPRGRPPCEAASASVSWEPARIFAEARDGALLLGEEDCVSWVRAGLARQLRALQ